MVAAENLLVARLPRVDRLRLSRLCTPVQWALGDVLHQPGDAMSHVYFPIDGFVSLVTVLMSQLSTSAACLRFHLVGARLARWLLMTQDRAKADGFDVTQEFLAYMLGVRRVGVSAAAGALQRSGLIRYHRGRLTVVDRTGLMAAACGCYAADLASYGSLLPVRPHPVLQPRKRTRALPAPTD